MLWEVSRGDVDHVPLLERALAALARRTALAGQAARPPRGRSASRHHLPAGTRESLSEEALEMARRIGDSGTLAYALAGYNAAHHSPAFPPRQVVLRPS